MIKFVQQRSFVSSWNSSTDVTCSASSTRAPGIADRHVASLDARWAWSDLNHRFGQGEAARIRKKTLVKKIEQTKIEAWAQSTRIAWLDKFFALVDEADQVASVDELKDETKKRWLCDAIDGEDELRQSLRFYDQLANMTVADDSTTYAQLSNHLHARLLQIDVHGLNQRRGNNLPARHHHRVQHANRNPHRGGNGGRHGNQGGHGNHGGRGRQLRPSIDSSWIHSLLPR